MNDTLKASKGRPRKLDIENGIHTARQMFWQWGYEGVSISSLCGKLNVPPTSVYAAYQSKAKLFELALDNYMADVNLLIEKSAENADDLPTFVRALLENLINLYNEGPDRAGCLLFESAIKSQDKGVEEAITARNDALNHQISRNVRKYTETNSEEITNVLMTMLKGLSAQLRDGQSIDDLIPTIEFFCVIFE